MTELTPVVSVVIPALDPGPMIEACLDSIGHAPDEVEVIVVDNASTDGAVDRAAATRPWVRVVRNERNLGFTGGCNRGAQQARGSLVLFLNADARLEQDALARLLQEAAEDATTAAWQAVVRHEDGAIEEAGQFFTWSGFFVRRRNVRGEGAYPVFAGTGACLLVRRDVFLRLGGFCEAYFAYIEDVDLCWRIRLAGHEVKVVTASQVSHVGHATTKRILTPHEARYLTFRNRIRTLLSNADLRALCAIVPIHLAICTASTIAFLVAGRPRSAWSIVRAVGWPLVHPRELWEQRRAVVVAASRREVIRRDLIAPLFSRATWELFRGHVSAWEVPAEAQERRHHR